MSSTVVAWLTQQVPHVLAAIALVAAGIWLANATNRLLLRMRPQLRIEPTLHGVLTSIARYTVLGLFFIAAIGQLGFEMSSVFAVLATAGLAIGLALQATLSNIAAGIMLLWLRPFRVGDQIEVATLTGRVAEVGLFACEIHSADGVFQFVPNSELWNKRVANYSRLPRRLVSVRVKVLAKYDLAPIRQLLENFPAADPRCLAEPAPRLTIVEIADDKITVAAEVWVPSAEYAAVQRDLADKLLALVTRGEQPD